MALNVNGLKMTSVRCPLTRKIKSTSEEVFYVKTFSALLSFLKRIDPGTFLFLICSVWKREGGTAQNPPRTFNNSAKSIHI